MTPREFRAWLLCQPRPVACRIIAGDGREHKFEISAGITWAAAGESIAALQPELVEALDAKGQMLRALRPREIVESDDDDDDAKEERIVTTDAETERFVIVARLLADAYRHSTDVAFSKLVDLLEGVTKRSESQDRSLQTMERMMRKQWEDQVLRQAGELQGDGEPLTLESLMAAFMQGQGQRAATAAKEAVNGIAAEAKEGGDNG